MRAEIEGESRAAHRGIRSRYQFGFGVSVLGFLIGVTAFGWCLEQGFRSFAFAFASFALVFFTAGLACWSMGAGYELDYRRKCREASDQVTGSD